jgi:hypothetical protein
MATLMLHPNPAPQRMSFGKCPPPPSHILLPLVLFLAFYFSLTVFLFFHPNFALGLQNDPHLIQGRVSEPPPPWEGR